MLAGPGEPWRGLGCRHGVVYRGKPRPGPMPISGGPPTPSSSPPAGPIRMLTVSGRHRELEGSSQGRRHVCQLCQPPGMQRGSRLTGLPAKGALLRAKRVHAKHNRTTRGWERTGAAGSWVAQLFPWHWVCCHNNLRMAERWAGLLARGETWIF